VLLDIFTFLSLMLAGYLGIMLVVGMILWGAVWLWQRLTGLSLDAESLEAGIQLRQQRTGKDAAAEQAVQALRSHHGPLP
jgi:hypothetical protein